MKIAILFTLLLAASPLAAHASDLSRDLQVPFEPTVNPFSGVAAKPLESSGALKALLERCTITPGRFNASGAIAAEFDTEILSACSAELSLNADKNILMVSSLSLEIVSWDGSHSDGGDEQSIGIYGTDGERLAVYPSLFSDGNVIDGIARAVGAQPPVVRR